MDLFYIPRKSVRIRIGRGLLANYNPACTSPGRRIVGVFILGTCAIPSAYIGIGGRENAPQFLRSKCKPGLRRQVRLLSPWYLTSIFPCCGSIIRNMPISCCKPVTLTLYSALFSLYIVNLQCLPFTPVYAKCRFVVYTDALTEHVLNHTFPVRQG